jgi:hypothetical protein
MKPMIVPPVAPLRDLGLSAAVKVFPVKTVEHFCVR